MTNPMHDAPDLVTAQEAFLGDSVVEYGVARPNPARVSWPDEDGEVFVDGDYRRAADLLALAASVQREGNGAYVVERAYTIARPVAPLPTTPGSLIRATVDGERILALLTEDQDSFPWKRANGDGDGWYSADEFSDVEILHEEAAK